MVYKMNATPEGISNQIKKANEESSSINRDLILQKCDKALLTKTSRCKDLKVDIDGIGHDGINKALAHLRNSGWNVDHVFKTYQWDDSDDYFHFKFKD